MKSREEDLALLGGQPVFTEKVHVGRPNVGDRERFMKRVESILESRWFTNNGACVQELEAILADWLGVKHCILVCNATIGLSVVARGLNLRGEVILPSLTFVATAHALAWQGIRPVFCDVDENTHLIDPQRVESLITPRTSGILGVHLWGHVCDVEQLQDIADRNDLALAFDAAHAFGCSVGGKRVGGFGAAEVFSFHATKFFNTFEGGAITTDDDDLAARLRLIINFGFAGYDDVVTLGLNGKMSEVSAAMGLTSFESLPDILAVNERNFRAYQQLLSAVPGCRLVEAPRSQDSNFQYVVVEYTAPPGGLSRDQLIEVLWAENIVARRYFYPGCHRMEPYRTNDPTAGERLIKTEAVAERLLILPTGTAVSVDDVASICDVIANAVRSGGALVSRCWPR